VDRQEGERAACVASVRRGGGAVPYWQQSPSVICFGTEWYLFYIPLGTFCISAVDFSLIDDPHVFQPL